MYMGDSARLITRKRKRQGVKETENRKCTSTRNEKYPTLNFSKYEKDKKGISGKKTT